MNIKRVWGPGAPPFWFGRRTAARSGQGRRDSDLRYQSGRVKTRCRRGVFPPSPRRNPPIAVADHDLILRAVELYEHKRLDFADAYLAAAADLTGVGAVASFDRALDRVATVERIREI